MSANGMLCFGAGMLIIALLLAIVLEHCDYGAWSRVILLAARVAFVCALVIGSAGLFLTSLKVQ